MKKTITNLNKFILKPSKMSSILKNSKCSLISNPPQAHQKTVSRISPHQNNVINFPNTTKKKLSIAFGPDSATSKQQQKFFSSSRANFLRNHRSFIFRCCTADTHSTLAKNEWSTPKNFKVDRRFSVLFPPFFLSLSGNRRHIFYSFLLS